VVAAEQRSAKVKKKLKIGPLHADTVRRKRSDGRQKHRGLSESTPRLRARRRALGRRPGASHSDEDDLCWPPRVQQARQVQDAQAYKRDVTVEAPPLIDQLTFDAVQAQLRPRNPQITPARVVSGPTLLTGICFCADCGGAMALRTGKGGRYRYYTCSILAFVLYRRQERAERRREHISELNKRAAETDLRLKRLYDAIEAGIADLDARR
jgi:hypothetical protein